MKPIILRSDQAPAFESIDHETLAICNMPTGWGKTILLCFLAASDILRGRKVVIVAPQKIIAKNFSKPKLLNLPDGRQYEWQVKHDLSEATRAKGLKLQAFLLKPPSDDPAERVCLTTHQSLAQVWSELGPEHFADTTLIVDESHHVQASEAATNQLGLVVDSLLSEGIESTRMIFATAYFFRGDSTPIIPDDCLGRFYRFSVPFESYWQSLKSIKTYAYDFVVYKGTVWQELEATLEANDVPTIIYCPPAGSPVLAGQSKQAFARKAVKLACSALSAEVWTPGTRPEKGRRYVLSLIESDDRQAKIQFISEHGDCLAAVLSVGMLKEGADWVHAARVLDLVPSGSDQDRLQRFGRLCRDCPKKKHVQYVSFFRWWPETDEDKRRRYLSSYYAHFHASLILANAISPIKLPSSGKGTRKKNQEEQREQYIDHLGKLSPAKQEEIIRESYEAMIRLHDLARIEQRQVGSDEVRLAVVEVVKKAGVTEDEEAFARQLVLVMRKRANHKLDVEKLLEAGFDRVWHVEALDGLLRYSADIGGPGTLSEMRSIVDGIFQCEWMANYERVSLLPQMPAYDSPLFWWCNNNKSDHIEGKLSAERVKLLESISWWQWRVSYEDRWQSNYSKAAACTSAAQADEPVKKWLGAQRKDMAKLPQWKQDKLREITWFKWSPKKTWRDRFEMLSKLDKQPPRMTAEGREFFHFQRAYRNNALPAEAIEALESLPWWRWVEGYKGRHCYWAAQMMARKSLPSGKSNEYKHVISLRKKYAEGQLEPEIIEQLESLPWWRWEARKVDWQSRLAMILPLKQKPAKGSEQFEALKYLRKLKQKRNLPAEAVKKLEALPWLTFRRASA